MIVLAGGTGRLGTEVVSRLAARGVAVRVLTRELARADHLKDVAAEIVKCDVRDRGGARSALRGASAIVSAVHGFAGPGRVSPASVDRDGNMNLIDAAVALEAEVILLSVVGASRDHPMDLFRAKYAAEQHLRASGASWTIVRATAFVELWAEIMKQPIVFGRGENPINFVSVGDVAAAVERAVLDTDVRRQVIEVGGPQNLTFNDLAALLQRTTGRAARVRHVPLPLVHLMAPLSRRARAAVAMDTIDMTFDAAAHRAYLGRPPTDLHTALMQGPRPLTTPPCTETSGDFSTTRVDTGRLMPEQPDHCPSFPPALDGRLPGQR
ncbi:MAG: SDR family oxidoreductase [Actinomycetota bacterium]|nr:SDR family oxidoreductase [Actinomycetota bacterium]